MNQYIPAQFIECNTNEIKVSDIGLRTYYEQWPDYERIKKWDLRFLEMAKLISTWSKDPSTQTGAVIVRGDKSILSVGYNGFPRAMPDPKEFYENREEKYSRIVHCEMNAMISAAAPPRGCTLYTYPFMSCDRCVVHMIQAGIIRFVFPKASSEKEERWGDAFKWAIRYMRECQVEYSEYTLDEKETTIT